MVFFSQIEVIGFSMAWFSLHLASDLKTNDEEIQMDMSLEELKRKLRHKHFCLDEIASLAEKAAYTIERLQEENALLANDLRIYQQALKDEAARNTIFRSRFNLSAHKENPSSAR